MERSATKRSAFHIPNEIVMWRNATTAFLRHTSFYGALIIILLRKSATPVRTADLKPFFQSKGNF